MMIFSKSKFIISFFFLLLICSFFVDPAMANKFETIGGGVSGSSKIKIEYLKIITYVIAGILFVSSALTVVTRNRNAQTLNYTMWKTSAIVFLILSVLFLAIGVYI